VSRSTQPQFNSIEIKKRLLDLGWTVKELAGRLGYARNTVSIAINHPSMLPTVKARILNEVRR
jgi:transcriptional regulator with XRE-family HTH domain